MFLLGANGSGKSSLSQKLFVDHCKTACLILGHRQMGFQSNDIPITHRSRETQAINTKGSYMQPQIRYRDNNASNRAATAIYDLINAENLCNRKVADAVRAGGDVVAGKIALSNTPLSAINELLRLSDIPVTVLINEFGEIAAQKPGGDRYSVAELSDGERNALLLASEVITVPSGTLIIIDEPERHLHRAIISPLLTHLFEKRDDCAFVVSTHEVMLPLDRPDSTTVLVRSCQFVDNRPQSWDVDLVPPGEGIDEDIRKAILGSRRSVLFVEGTGRSLDKPLYSLLFPGVSVIPVGSCVDVEHAVSAIRDSKDLHWTHAFGLVDYDRRLPADIERLKEKGVHTLKAYSVESVYYLPAVLKAMAARSAAFNGGDAASLESRALKEIIDAVGPRAQRMSERVAEKAVRGEILGRLPTSKDVQTGAPVNISVDVAKLVIDERKRLDKALSDANVEAIVSNYPVRETPALAKAATALGFKDCRQYERVVLQLLRDDANALKMLQSMFGSLTADMDV
jgi:ABC-type dipeptide/oligopeptide/nickel transport system ATPase component